MEDSVNLQCFKAWMNNNIHLKQLDVITQP